MKCPLCNYDKCDEIDRNKKRVFFKCKKCTLIFVPSQYYVSLEEEFKRYELHNNSEKNEGYLNFLEEVANVTTKYIESDDKILDFGCGKEAILCKIMRKKGLKCDPYDPLYNYPLPNEKYDAIIMCEVIEHCRNLQETLEIINSHLKKNGVLIIRTKIYPSERNISTWWYSQDITHINFFSLSALRYIAEVMKKNITSEATDIFVIYPF